MTSSDTKGMGIKAGGAKKTTLGVKTTKRVKSIGCSNLKTLIENEKLEIPDLDTIEELGTFIAKGNSYEADEGAHDDCVMTLVLFSWFSKQEMFSEYSGTNIVSSVYESSFDRMSDELAPFGGRYGGNPDGGSDAMVIDEEDMDFYNIKDLRSREYREMFDEDY